MWEPKAVVVLFLKEKYLVIAFGTVPGVALTGERKLFLPIKKQLTREVLPR